MFCSYCIYQLNTIDCYAPIFYIFADFLYSNSICCWKETLTFSTIIADLFLFQLMHFYWSLRFYSFFQYIFCYSNWVNSIALSHFYKLCPLSSTLLLIIQPCFLPTIVFFNWTISILLFYKSYFWFSIFCFYQKIFNWGESCMTDKYFCLAGHSSTCPKSQHWVDRGRKITMSSNICPMKDNLKMFHDFYLRI